MNAASDRIRWFKDIRLEDVPLVGGKTASLGELYSALSPQGVRVPNGFAVTAKAYRDALSNAGAWEKLRALLDGVDKRRIVDLAKRASAARAIVYAAPIRMTCAARSSKPIGNSNRNMAPMSRLPSEVRRQPKTFRPRASRDSTIAFSTSVVHMT